MSHYRILDTKIMARYAYSAFENALYEKMKDIDKSRKTEIIYPLQKDILETTKDTKELMRSFLMDTDYTKDLNDDNEDYTNTLATFTLTKEKKFGYVIYIDLPVENTLYTYMIAFVDNGKNDGSFALSTVVTACSSDDYMCKDAVEVDDPETDLTGFPKEIYDTVKSTLDKFLESVNCVRSDNDYQNR